MLDNIKNDNSPEDAQLLEASIVSFYFWAFSILIFSLGLGTYYAHLNPIFALFIVNVGVCKLAMKLQLCGWEAKACVTRMCEAALKAQALARLSDISTT